MARGWTQEELARHSGLSVRTVQRLEAGHAATLESLKCLAATFETNVSTLMQEQSMSTGDANIQINEQSQREKEAIEYVQGLKGLCMHGMLFAVIVPSLFVLNLIISPQALWILYVIAGWLFGLGLHAAILFGFYGPFGGEWEQRQFRKRMETKQHQ